MALKHPCRNAMWLPVGHRDLVSSQDHGTLDLCPSQIPAWEPTQHSGKCANASHWLLWGMWRMEVPEHPATVSENGRHRDMGAGKAHLAVCRHLHLGTVGPTSCSTQGPVPGVQGPFSGGAHAAGFGTPALSMAGGQSIAVPALPGTSDKWEDVSGR